MPFSVLHYCLIAWGLFAWMPMSYYRMVSWPWVGLWQGATLGTAGWLLWRWRQLEQPVFPLGYGLDVGVALTLGAVVLSAAGALVPGAAWGQVAVVIAYILGAYALRQGLKTGTIAVRDLWWGVAIAAIGCALISLAQWRPTPEMWLGENFATAIRNPHPLGHHNFVGGYFTLTLPWVVALAITESGRRRWGVGLGAAVIFIALFVSGSRGAALGAVVGIVATVVGSLCRPQRPRYQGWLGLGVVMVAIAGLLANPRTRASFLALGGGGGDLLLNLSQVDGPLIDRLFMAQAGLNLVRDRPWLGAGPGNVARLFNLYRPIEMGNGLDHVQQLHNTPIHLLGELGAMGLGLYGLWLGLLAGLGWRLARQLPPGRDRILVLALGVSGLSYTISSLTDYQLENIPITLTLIMGVMSLVTLADQAQLTLVAPLSRSWQRVSSFAILGAIALLVPLWLRFDSALWLSYRAIQDVDQGELIAAHQKWGQATELVPWDPTAPALAAQSLLELETLLPDSSSQPAIAAGILENLKAAYLAAPNDAYFNRNLAIRLLPIAPQVAETFASRAAQLLPRTLNHPYYLLGLTYLAQDKVTAAVTAFALEGLITPGFTTLPLWQGETLAPLLPPVLEKTLLLYTVLLDRLTPEIQGYDILYEQAQLLRWWHQLPPLPPQPDRLSPLAAALLQVETAPAAALDRLQGAIAADPENPGLLMLRAWIDPSTYLETLLTPAMDAEERQQITDHIQTYRTLPEWLRSLTEVSDPRQRRGLAFAYRNWDANRINRILRPHPLEIYTLVDLLPVFHPWPREFPALDQLVEAIKASELGLVHPTRNGYRLPEPDLDF